MKKAIADKWVKALRSGKYKQGSNHLARDGKYCCLGVLCDLAAKESIVEVNKKYSHIGFDESGNGGDELLPCSVQKWAGMKTSTGRVENEPCLTRLNDHGLINGENKPFSFEDIANIIEDYYKDL